MSSNEDSSSARPKDATYYRGLARNMSLNIITVALAPMLLVTGIFTYQFHRSYGDKVRAHLTELVLKHQREIDMYLKQQLGMIRFLADTSSLEQLSDEDYLGDVLAHLHSRYGQGFSDLGFVDAEGKQVAYAGPFRLERALYAGADWFKQARARQTYISDVFLGLRGLPHFIVAVRKPTPQGEFILRATVDFEVFSSLVGDIRVGKTGFAYILNAAGELQTRYKAEHDVRAAPASLPGFDSSGFGAPNSGVSNSSVSGSGVSIGRTTDGHGHEYIVVSVPLKHGNWQLVYQQDERDAYGMMVSTRMLAVTVLLLGSALIVTTVLFLSRRMVARVARADHEKEEVDRQMVEAGRLAAIGELAAGIAHEINNPVAIMVEEAGWMEDLIEDGAIRTDGLENVGKTDSEAGCETESETGSEDGRGEFTRALEQIRLQGQRCKEITHKLLHFARRSDSTAQRIDVEEMVEQILSLVKQRARYSKVNIVAQLQGRLPAVFGSPSELQQVILNLVNNAIDAMGREGGLIAVSTGLREVGERSYVFIRISDNGQGIPEANLSRIFDPFFTTKPVGRGTGLGLSICYGIVTRMNGEIEVQSHAGEGTEFTVLLPVSEGETADGDTALAGGGGA